MNPAASRVLLPTAPIRVGVRATRIAGDTRQTPYWAAVLLNDDLWDSGPSDDGFILTIYGFILTIY